MRKNTQKVDTTKANSPLADLMIIVKSSIIAVIITLLLFIILSIIMKIGNLDESIIPPTSQGIRVLSMALGGAISAQASKAKGWLKGALTGIMYILWAFVISALFGHRVKLDKIVLSDLGMGFIVGAIGGIIGINLK